MPESKDFVSVGEKQHMQKRLLLVNLKELYSSFLKDHADIPNSANCNQSGVFYWEHLVPTVYESQKYEVDIRFLKS